MRLYRNICQKCGFLVNKTKELLVLVYVVTGFQLARIICLRCVTQQRHGQEIRNDIAYPAASHALSC
jgi:hypothetical protein